MELGFRIPIVSWIPVFRFSDFIGFYYLHIDYIGILICKSTLGNNVRNKCVVTKVANASGLVTATYVKLADIDT